MPDAEVQALLAEESVAIQQKALQVQFHMQDMKLKRLHTERYEKVERELRQFFTEKQAELTQKLEEVTSKVQGLEAQIAELTTRSESLSQENAALKFRNDEMHHNMFSLTTNLNHMTAERDGLKVTVWEQEQLLKRRVMDSVVTNTLAKVGVELDGLIDGEIVSSASILHSRRKSMHTALRKSSQSPKFVSITTPKVEALPNSLPPSRMDTRTPLSVQQLQYVESFSHSPGSPGMRGVLSQSPFVPPPVIPKDLETNEVLGPFIEKHLQEHDKLVTMCVGLSQMTAELQKNNAIVNCQTMETRVREAMEAAHNIYLEKFATLKLVYSDREEQIVSYWRKTLEAMQTTYNERKDVNRKLMKENKTLFRDKMQLTEMMENHKAETQKLAQHVQQLQKTFLSASPSDNNNGIGVCVFCKNKLERAIIDVHYSYLKDTVPTATTPTTPRPPPRTPDDRNQKSHEVERGFRRGKLIPSGNKTASQLDFSIEGTPLSRQSMHSPFVH
eukprot:PhF_6_TR27790/c0_g1_i1/m.40477